MPRAAENRSLDRGLAVLNALSVHGASSLGNLHAHTRLPKSTIRRILGTLIRRRIVRRSLSDQLYRANFYLPTLNSRFAQGEGLLVDRALPRMIELTRSVGWSCDLHIFERTRSRIIESTRPLSPYFQFERHIDHEVSVFASAAGLAVLSTWTNQAALALADELGDHPVWGLPRVAMTKRQLLTQLLLARQQGYAVRAASYRSETPLANKLHAIGCPVFGTNAAIGSLVMLWPRDLLDPQEFAALHAERLKAAARAISADLDAG
jgi:IclR family transcriptional regulator, mhp operon transcriptional activator